MKVLVCGDRWWGTKLNEKNERIPAPEDVAYLNNKLDELDNQFQFSYLIEGEARGADTLARQWANNLWIPVQEFPAKWDEFGKSAGPRRNQQMLDEGKPDLVVAFHHDIEHSKGTADMVKRAQKAGFFVKVYDGTN